MTTSENKPPRVVPWTWIKPSAGPCVNSVAEKIREELRNACSVAIDRPIKHKPGLKRAVGASRLDLGHHLLKGRLERSPLTIHMKRAAQTAAREIQDVIDKRSHADHALLHHGTDVPGSLARRFPQ